MVQLCIHVLSCCACSNGTRCLGPLLQGSHQVLRKPPERQGVLVHAGADGGSHRLPPKRCRGGRRPEHPRSGSASDTRRGGTAGQVIVRRSQQRVVRCGGAGDRTLQGRRLSFRAPDRSRR